MGSVAAASGALELEAKRTEDSSWHPCQVSLKPSYDAYTSSALILDLEGQSFEEVIYTKEEAMKRLRIRSTPLQGDECFHVKEGEHVLASQTTKFGILFFDAEVEKVFGVRHSKRNPCRCTFRIKWLCKHPGIRTETVPASSIMKLATTSIDSHKTIVEFLNSFDTFNSSGASSFASLFEESGFEFDLEKQIEELSRLADVSDNGTPVEFTKVDLTGQVRHRTLASQVSFQNDKGPHEQNNSRRTTRSRKKVLLESETIQSPPKSVTLEPDRPLLSPLGARAALASFMYKSPPAPEVSPYNVEREGLTNAVQNTGVTHTMISLDVTTTITDSGPSTRKKSIIKDGNVKDSPAPVDPKQTKVRRSGRRDSSNSFLQTTVMQDELESPRSTTRATRSTRLRNQNGTEPNDEVDPKSSSEEPKIPSPTQTPRFTRSAIQKDSRQAEVEVLQTEAVNGIVDTPKGQQKGKSAQGTDSRSTRLRGQKGLEHPNDETELKSSSEDTKLLSPTQRTRFTRSAIQNEAVNGTVDVDNDLVTPQSNKTRRKKPLSSDDEVKSAVAQESTKKPKVSENKGEIAETGAGLQGKNSVSSKTSLILRSSPRTRSQNKSS